MQNDIRFPNINLAFGYALPIEEKIIFLQSNSASKHDFVSINSHAPVYVIEDNLNKGSHHVRACSLVEKVLSFFLSQSIKSRCRKHELNSIEEI